MANLMAKEFIFGKTRLLIKVNLKKERSMVTEFGQNQSLDLMKDITRTIKRMVKAPMYGRLVTSMLVTL